MGRRCCCSAARQGQRWLCDAVPAASGGQRCGKRPAAPQHQRANDAVAAGGTGPLSECLDRGLRHRPLSAWHDARAPPWGRRGGWRPEPKINSDVQSASTKAPASHPKLKASLDDRRTSQALSDRIHFI